MPGKVWWCPEFSKPLRTRKHSKDANAGFLRVPSCPLWLIRILPKVSKTISGAVTGAFAVVSKSLLHPAANEQRVRNCTQNVESYFVVDDIADACARSSIANLSRKFMAVMPALEGASFLHVGEVMVPFKFGDARDPLGPKRQEREHAKRSHDGRASAGGGGS